MGAGVIGLGLTLLSFVNGEQPAMKRYEVIRSVNGVVTTYDTLVANDSEFTPEDFLASLGFSNDDHVEIINVLDLPNPADLGIPCKATGIQMEVDRMVLMQDENIKSLDSMLQIQMEILTEQFSNGDSAIVIEKNVVIRHCDSGMVNMHSTEDIMQLILLDSLLDPSMMQLDSHMVMVHTIVMDNGEGHAGEQGQTMQWTTMGGQPDFERHDQNGNHSTDVVVFSGGEDFTLVIVSDGTQTSPRAQLKIEDQSAAGNPMKLYPNPADREVTLQLSFEQKAMTTLTVTDAAGKVVHQLNLGDFSGNYTHTLDVAKWKKGIYFVRVERPGVKLVEKLVVE